MADVIIVGDGPAGLSAALFLAKRELETLVFGKDETAMHYAMLYNYLGIPEMTGSAFQAVARQQVSDFGASLIAEHVTRITPGDDGFTVETDAGNTYTSTYLVLAEGKSLKLAEALGLEKDDTGVKVDQEYRTSIKNLYVTGRTAKTQRSQAIISAGAGAVAALDILAKAMGKAHFVDYDVPPKDDD